MTIQGGSQTGNRATGMRSAAGANAVTGASSARIQGFVDNIIEQAFVPVLNAFIEMDRQRMDASLMRKVVGEQLWGALDMSHQGDYLVDMRNATDVQVSVLASSNLAARSKMASSLPILSEMFMQPAFQSALQSNGYKVNWLEMGRRMEQVSGWDAAEEIFIPLTVQDKQQAIAQNPEILKAQSTKARLDQMQQHKLELAAQNNQHKLQQIQSKGLTDAGQEVLTKSVERAQVREEEPEISGNLGSF
jgi:hypothetical protein